MKGKLAKQKCKAQIYVSPFNNTKLIRYFNANKIYIDEQWRTMSEKGGFYFTIDWLIRFQYNMFTARELVEIYQFRTDKNIFCINIIYQKKDYVICKKTKIAYDIPKTICKIFSMENFVHKNIIYYFNNKIYILNNTDFKEIINAIITRIKREAK